MIEWLEQHMGTCYFKAYTGINCPGCGMQRSIIELLKGNIWESIKFYPGLLPLLFLFLFLVLHLIFKFNNGTTILKFIYITTASIILINYITNILIQILIN